MTIVASGRPDSRHEKSPAPCFQDAGRKFWQRPTLAQPIDALPSGLQRFTSVFGMGTGGATALGSPECGTALAISLLSQRRKREAEFLETFVSWRLGSIAVI